MAYLLDTDTCSFLMRQTSAVLQQRFADVAANAVAMSVVTHGELLTGLARKPGATQLATRMERLFTAVPALGLPIEAAQYYAQIRAHLESKGTLIGGNDMWIAAHALATDRTLVTHNTREFKRVKGLKVEDWL
ncbi:MAG: type II toxin-antitoxin system VapC family toxin [Rhodoferax sp.]|nr:type II toxin-antitoxin system VapC family toxin [Rhodoferax sp.]